MVGLVEGLIGLVGGEDGGPRAGRDLEEQADEGVEGQLAGVLLGGVLPEKLFQSLRIEERFHDATDHDAEGNRRAMGENLSRNHLEGGLSKKFLELVDKLGPTSTSASIGLGPGTRTST